MQRRARGERAGEAGFLGVAQWGDRVLGAVGRGADRLGGHAERARCGAERQRARGILTHAGGDGRAAAQRVEHDRADGGAVARPGEAMRLAPVGQRRGCRAVSGEDVVEDFRRRRDPRACAHIY